MRKETRTNIEQAAALALNRATYDKSAAALADYFKTHGARVGEIERALELAGKTDGSAKVVEIGCGDGRDAEEIQKRVGEYRGFDISAGLIDIARKKASDGDYTVADAVSYDYGQDNDVIYAFASILHLSQDELKTMLAKVAISLRTGGILYLATKYREKFEESLREDEFGSRVFYYYSPELVVELAGDSYQEVFRDFYELGDTTWFRLALKKTK